MKVIQQLLARLLTAAMAVCALLWAVVPAWAQEGEGNLGADGPGPWVLPYALVILGIGLGLMAILKPGKRRERPQLDRWETKEEEE